MTERHLRELRERWRKALQRSWPQVSARETQFNTAGMVDVTIWNVPEDVHTAIAWLATDIPQLLKAIDERDSMIHDLMIDRGLCQPDAMPPAQARAELEQLRKLIDCVEEGEAP